MRNSFIELLFPRFCLGCGYIGSYICVGCEEKMKRIKTPHCFYCDKPTLLGFTHPQCKKTNGIDGYLSVYLYHGLLKKTLQESKYKGGYNVLKTLLSFPQPSIFDCLYEWQTLFKPIVESVPLHQQRIRERGFNQSDLITKAYCNSKVGTEGRLLERTINTEHLASMRGKAKRRDHIQGAFSFIGSSTPKAVLLIDDVITSGSTILECTKTLKENGVQIVLALSLAKG